MAIFETVVRRILAPAKLEADVTTASPHSEKIESVPLAEVFWHTQTLVQYLKRLEYTKSLSGEPITGEPSLVSESRAVLERWISQEKAKVRALQGDGMVCAALRLLDNYPRMVSFAFGFVAAVLFFLQEIIR